jgi:hypothetical protein
MNEWMKSLFQQGWVKIDILWIISQTITKFLLQEAQIHQKHVTSWVYTPQNNTFLKWQLSFIN